MRAIRVEGKGGPEVLQFQEVADLEPGPGQLLIRTEAVGVNFIDVYQREGLYPLPTPYTPGQEAAGVVAGIGTGVTTFSEGDRIAYQGALGSYSEYTLIPAERAVALPDGVSTREGAAAMVQGLTAHYLATSTFPLQAGQTCLIHAAAGGVGLLLCQMAKLRGATVIGTASTDEKVALARGAGADHMVVYTEDDFQDIALRVTDGRGVDVVYDSVGRDTFDASLGCLRPRGMLALFGQSSGPVAPFDPQRLNRGGSLFLTRPSLGHYVSSSEELAARTSEIFGWIASGALSMRIGLELPLSDAAEAHRRLEARATTGKVLLIPG